MAVGLQASAHWACQSRELKKPLPDASRRAQWLRRSRSWNGCTERLGGAVRGAVGEAAGAAGRAAAGVDAAGGNRRPRWRRAEPLEAAPRQGRGDVLAGARRRTCGQHAAAGAGAGRSGLRGWRGRTSGLGFCGCLRRLRRRFGFRKPAKMLSRQLGMIEIERAGMGLFLRHADLGQKIDQHLGFDLKFSRQFVDTDLIGI